MKESEEQTLNEILCPVDVERHRFTVKGDGEGDHELIAYGRYCTPVWQPSDLRCVPPGIIEAKELCVRRNGLTNLLSEDKDVCDLVAEHVGAAFYPGGREYDDAFDQEIAYQARSLSLKWVDFTRGALPAFGVTAFFYLPFSVHPGSSEFQRDAAQLYLERSVMLALRLPGKKDRAASLTVLQRIKKSLDIRATAMVLDAYYTEPVKKKLEA